MPPKVALFAFASGILGLVWLDRDPEKRSSKALWIPIVWLLIAASRMLSHWVAGSSMEFDTPEQYLEGSPLDRLIFMALLFCGLTVLAARGRRTGRLLARNWPLLLFFLYCLVSTVWSDYPFVAFKRWTKAIGNLVMVMVVLTDSDPNAAVKRLLTRAGFVLIPLSVMLIKYFPEYGRSYLTWVWSTIYVGAASTKNGLGYICLIFGLASTWRLLDSMRTETGSTRFRRLAAHGTILVMVAWLFYKADSATSLVCFFVGLLLLLITVSPHGRRPALIHLTIGMLLVTGVVSYFFLDAQAQVAQSFGRDSSLTGRTELWATLLEMVKAPWFGTGFESFWLGERSELLWKMFWWHPNQAHNGYLETYINLGWVGIAFLTLAIGFGYRTAVASCYHDPRVGPIRLAYVVVAVIYNLTEAAYKGIHPVWIAFFLASTASPIDARAEAASDLVPDDRKTDVSEIKTTAPPRFVPHRAGAARTFAPPRHVVH